MFAMPQSREIIMQAYLLVPLRSPPSSPTQDIGAAPAAACRGYACGRWHGLLADDPGDHLDALLGVAPMRCAPRGALPLRKAARLAYGQGLGEFEDGPYPGKPA